MDKVIFLSHCFVLGCWFSLQVTLCYLAGHLRLPHVTCQHLNQSFVKPVCIRFWPMNQCVVWLICFLFPCLPCVCYCRHNAYWSNCCGKTQPDWNVPYGSVSCCCGIFAIELVILSIHYLNFRSFQIYCSHLVIHVVRWKLSGFFWFPVCLLEVPELSGRYLGCGRAKFTHLVSSCW